MRKSQSVFQKGGTSKLIYAIFLFLLFQAGLMSIKAQISLPKVFSDHMVLQRGVDVPLWGKAEPGTAVTVKFHDQSITTTTDKNGQWKVHLPEMHAGGPFLLEIFANEEAQPSITFKDVLIGDVYLASGQSNMEWQVQQSMNADEEIKNANYPNIRLFDVPNKKTIKPQDNITGGSWQICDTASVKDKSAVAYFFARNLHEDLNISIGILQSTWGGTPVEAWTSREMLLSSPIIKQQVLNNDSVTPEHFVKDSLDLIRFWEIVYNPQNESDEKYPKPTFDDSSWKEVQMPLTLKDWDMPYYEGIIWLRRTIKIPESMAGKDLTINLGHPELNYSLYFNDKEICKNIWNANLSHEYTLPAKNVKPGKNQIAVRMAFLWGGGGFNPPAENMYITDGEDKISLTGAWKYKKDLEPEIPKIHNYHKFPSYLYNAMINPIIPYGIKGVIWYQGEENASRAYDYRELFPMLINDWRIRWKQGYIPFMYVQLANYMKTRPKPSESEWAELRESQTMALSLPNTGMACIIDIGEADNIHPKNKQEVGRRLSLIAKNLVYGKKIQAYGPRLDSITIDKNKIRIHFKETGAGLTSADDQDIKGFAVAGKDKKFYWAKAKIDGDDVVVSSDNVSSPVAVRYGWADNPECNLINKEGLPAVPFRTDEWPGITEN